MFFFFLPNTEVPEIFRRIILEKLSSMILKRFTSVSLKHLQILVHVNSI